MGKALKGLLHGILYIVIILLITYLIVAFVGQRTEVNGDSMVPTLENGDQLITDKLTYHFKDPERFDIIVFPYNPEEGEDESALDKFRETLGFKKSSETYFIKRIIGLPGETVWIDETDGTIYIDGKPLDENYGNSVMTFAGTASTPITLGDDEYFVLGDNRAISKDSRYPDVGNIKRENIAGRAWLRLYPFSKFGLLKHQ